MNKFEETNLIVAQGKNVMQMNSLDELIDRVFGDEYRNLNKKEKLKMRYNKAIFQAMLNNMKVLYSPKVIIKKDRTFDNHTPYEIDKCFIIDDETTFLLSLCKVNDLRILEREDSNIFLSDEDRKEIKSDEGNYVFINKRVDQIMSRHIHEKKGKEGPEIE